jgi:hypothetical protein
LIPHVGVAYIVTFLLKESPRMKVATKAKREKAGTRDGMIEDEAKGGIKLNPFLDP